MEQENKVTIEETSVNWGCVKKELKEEFEFAENQYKVALTYENIFGETSKEHRNNLDSLIGFLDDDIVMETETGSIKLEDVKEENKKVIRSNIEQSYCNRCGGNYDGYCLNCSSLSHILNNLTPNINPEPDLNTTPINTLEIRKVSRGQAVFALKTLRKGIILGPFEGIISIESTNGLRWKIKDKKFVNDQNGNWMKYIENVENHMSKNLDVFQFDGILYFETSREIQEGEELLVCYDVEEVLKLDKEEEFYLVPVKKEKYPRVFACTLCCLGFRLKGCLVEHKSKCPHRDHGVNIEDFEITQCHYCKVWLEKREHLEGHMQHCLENCNRLSQINTGEDVKIRGCDEISQSIELDATLSTEIINSKRFCEIDCKDDHFQGDNTRNQHPNTIEKDYKCSDCSYETNCKRYLKRHLNTHSGIKPFECDICKKRFTQKSSMKLHIISCHSNTSEKEYKCTDCSYQTNGKRYLKRHLNTHRGIKPFACEICQKKFKQKHGLKYHVTNEHSNTSEKEYKCPECHYQTNLKGNLNIHLNIHKDIKAFECDICEKRFTLKSHLQIHIRNQHSNTSEKEYKCSECCYQTNLKGNLKQHLNTHSDIKAFECDICKIRFNHKNSLKLHIKNKHSNSHNDIFECDICKKRYNVKCSLKRHIKNQHPDTSEKEYKCSECSYATNYKDVLKNHLNTHKDIKAFECDICKKKLTQKRNLKRHIKNYHSNTQNDIKPFECDTCKKRFTQRSHLTVHIQSTHNNITPFECDICKKKFSLKSNLKVHIRNRHSNSSEKEYKCSACSYQTNLKENLKRHLNTHQDIKAFECDICKKGFNHKISLKLHIRNHHSNTSEKKYKCSECPYQSNLKGNLNIHLNIHNDIKAFECDICKKKFTLNNNLQRHIRYQHSNTSE